jgi:hypothetical protein
VLAGEGRLSVVYYVQEAPTDWDGTSVRVVGPDTPGEPAAIVRFVRPHASMFGPPNDEAFSGHPLARRGLHPYAAFEVHDSSWIRGLERMNRVHSCHRPERFAAYRHFILAFHGSTFECIAEGYEHELVFAMLNELIAQEAVRVGG